MLVGSSLLGSPSPALQTLWLQSPVITLPNETHPHPHSPVSPLVSISLYTLHIYTCCLFTTYLISIYIIYRSQNQEVRLAKMISSNIVIFRGWGWGYNWWRPEPAAVLLSAVIKCRNRGSVPSLPRSLPANMFLQTGLVLQTINRRSCTIMEKAPTRAWLKSPSSTFTFKTLLRHYAK